MTTALLYWFRICWSTQLRLRLPGVSLNPFEISMCMFSSRRESLDADCNRKTAEGTVSQVPGNWYAGSSEFLRSRDLDSLSWKA